MARPVDGAPPALEMRGVRVRRRDRIALDLDHLAIAPGERVAIVGPNGAGKTTLLHAAALIAEPEAGAIALSGELVAPGSGARLRRTSAIVLQQPALFRGSVLDNAALGLRLRGARPADARATAGEWLARFGVGALADRKPATLSGGEAQRVALARAFAVEPRLLLLDEPFSSLDAASRAALLPDLAKALAASGAAAVLVTHDLREAAAFGDRLGVLLSGRLAQIAAPGEVLSRPATLEAARVLGIENLLPGVALLDADGQGWAIRLEPVNAFTADAKLPSRGGMAADGCLIRCATAGNGVIAGGPCWLAIRAGAARLLAGPAPGAMPCVVQSSEVTPDGWRVMVSGAVSLTVHGGWDGPPPPIGAEIWAMIPPDRSCLVTE